MTVLRIAPATNKQFFMASNDFARDPDISSRACKVYIYLISHSEGWQVTVRSVATATGLGKNTVASALRDLEQAGFIDRHQLKDSSGQFAGVEYLVHRERQPRPKNGDTGTETHNDRNPKSGNRNDQQKQDNNAGQPRNPKNGNPDNGNPESGSHKKTNSLEKINLQEDQEENTPPIVPQGGQRPTYPEAFELFWKTYPRRVGKRAAFKAWEKARKRAGEEDILFGAEALARDPNLPEERFIPHPTTWLNRDGWEDAQMPALEQGPKSADDYLAEWGIADDSPEWVEGEVVEVQSIE